MTDNFPDHLATDYVLDDLDPGDHGRVEERMGRDALYLQEVLEMQATAELLRGMWHRVATEPAHASTSRRRARLSRIAIAAILFILVGVSAVAFIKQANPLSDRKGMATTIAVSPPYDANGQSPQVNPQRPTAPAGRDSSGLLASGVPATPLRYTLGEHPYSVPLFPRDPLNPFTHKTWFYPRPGRVVEVHVEADGPRHHLLFKISLEPLQRHLDQARRELARSYKANGQPTVEPEQIHLQPLDSLGYKVVLKSERGDIIVGEHRNNGGFVTGSTELPFTTHIPSDRRDLIDTITKHPDFAQLLLSTYHPFEYSSFATTEARALRSGVQNALSKVAGKVPEGGIVVNREGKQRLLELFHDEVATTLKEFGMAADSMNDLVIKQTQRLQPMTSQEFLERPQSLFLYNKQLARWELRPEQYERIAEKTREFNKQRSTLESSTRSLSNLATHEDDEIRFINQAHEIVRTQGSGGASFLGIGAKFGLDLSRTCDRLTDEQKKRVRDFKSYCQNENALRTDVFKEHDSTFEGRDLVAGTNPKDLDVYLVSEATLVSNALFSHSHVRVLDVKTMAIDQPLSLRPMPAAAEELATLAERMTSIEKKLGETLNGEIGTLKKRVSDEVDVHRRRVDELQKQIETLRKQVETAEAKARARPRMVTGEWRFHWADAKSGIIGEGDNHHSRCDSKTVRFYFPTRFNKPPNVHVCISMLAASHPEIEALASNITEEHFDLRVVWHGAHPGNGDPQNKAWWDLFLTWIAVPSDDVDHPRQVEVLP